MELREMLELAALAAGHKIHSAGLEYDDFIIIEGDDGDVIWAPNTDDGDSFRLAVKLGMTISLESPDDPGAVCRVVADWSTETGWPNVSLTEPHGDDPLAATRMAVLRAASEIGKSMKEKSNG